MRLIGPRLDTLAPVSLRILVVCTANVCRSPMGEALLRHHCAAADVAVQVASAGVRTAGLPVDPQAVALLAGMGLDIATHRPRQLDSSVLDGDGADLVLVMTREHLRIAATTGKSAFRRTFTVREFERHLLSCPPEAGEGLDGWLGEVAKTRQTRDLLGDDPRDDVADPYGGSGGEYRQCVGELDRLCRTTARALAVMTAAG